MVQCCVLGCQNRTEQGISDVTFHRFPSSAGLVEIWIEACGRYDWRPTRNSRICSNHFMRDLIIRRGNKNFLKPGALPTNNIHIMDERKRHRCAYVSAKQKKKLIELITKHPELISCKVTQEFSYKDSQRLWQNIANECNSVPGAKKTWKQWKKTWQDLRSKTKKRQETNSELPTSIIMLTPAEQEALGLKNVSSTTSYQDSTEFVPLGQENVQENLNNELESEASYSEEESPPELKVFTRSVTKAKKLKNNTKHSSKHSSTCVFNCDMLAIQEQRKMQLKEDYVNFKKNYLRQKLKLMKEQTEALKNIAKELSK